MYLFSATLLMRINARWMTRHVVIYKFITTCLIIREFCHFNQLSDICSNALPNSMQVEIPILRKPLFSGEAKVLFS